MFNIHLSDIKLQKSRILIKKKKLKKKIKKRNGRKINLLGCINFNELIANVGQSMTTENLIEKDDNDFIDKNEDKNNPSEENDQTSELQNDTLHAASVISQEKVIIKRKHSPMMAKETLKNSLTNKVKKNSLSFQNAVSQLHEITQMTTEINDEYECFAKYITSQFKQLPLRSFVVLQEKIQSLITQERLASIGQLASYPSSSLSSYIYSINSNVDRPNKNIDKDNYEDDLEKFMKINRLMPDKEFCVIDNRSTIRSGTVQCEKDEEDPFDLDKFLEQTKHIDNSTNLTKQFKDERDHQRRGNRNKRRKY
ncbi:uncharacterized protein LOC118440853 isoform X1 [Vespa mandarinia]|uniref:uncharacterized protein LOC118440853 isoform X1 n=2 Tax=Vespa mandarinia TaxID=7446 RepID=UPI001621A18E|nr:uncharacterized protein LOC118440853 isoform X1 [Vespa mandarinia]